MSEVSVPSVTSRKADFLFVLAHTFWEVEQARMDSTHFWRVYRHILL